MILNILLLLLLLLLLLVFLRWVQVEVSWQVSLRKSRCTSQGPCDSTKCVRSISEISSCFLGPRPWHIEIRHRVKKTSTINLFGFETLKLKIRRLKLWKPTPQGASLGELYTGARTKSCSLSSPLARLYHIITYYIICVCVCIYIYI